MLYMDGTVIATNRKLESMICQNVVPQFCDSGDQVIVFDLYT